MILVFVVLGGMGNFRGSIIAAVLLTLLPEVLRGLSDYRMLIYSIVLIVMMLFNWAPKCIEWRQKMAQKFRKTQRRRQYSYGNVRGKESWHLLRRTSCGR